MAGAGGTDRRGPCRDAAPSLHFIMQLIFFRFSTVFVIPDNPIPCPASRAGITGQDIVAEAGFHVDTLMVFPMGHCRLSVQTPKGAHTHSVSSLMVQAA